MYMHSIFIPLLSVCSSQLLNAYDTDAEYEECDPTENELSHISDTDPDKLGAGKGDKFN